MSGAYRGSCMILASKHAKFVAVAPLSKLQ